MTEHQRELLKLIEDAFRDVELGDGVSLHEADVIDTYGPLWERRAARETDEKHDWRKLVSDPELIRVGADALSFYDAIGLRFHMPAYLSLAVTDPIGDDTGRVVADLMYHLTHIPEFQRERFSILSALQRACVREVLKYLRNVYDTPDNGWLVAEMDYALDGYWSSES
jgi:hypothetical protein